jgi:hypothetical protein
MPKSTKGTVKTDKLRAIVLAIAISDGDVRRRLYRDIYCRYSADPWTYIVQEASQILISIMAGILSNYAYASLSKSKSEITVNDLFTREIDDNIVSYCRAVDRLREHRVQKKSNQKSVDVILVNSDRIIKVLESQSLDSIDLLELVAEINSFSPQKVASLARQFDRYAT